jgi:hypothetical protein
MGFLNSGHEVNQVIIESFSFINKLVSLPNQDLGNQISNRLRLHMITYNLGIVFGRLEKEVQKLFLLKKIHEWAFW